LQVFVKVVERAEAATEGAPEGYRAVGAADGKGKHVLPPV
jgi:hypothetical protein